MYKRNLLKTYLFVISGIVIAGCLFFNLIENKVKADTEIPMHSAPAKSLCMRDEQTIWSCSTTKNKIISVCASKGLTSEKGFVQYRFGTTNKLELEFPKDKSQSINSFKYSRYTRPLVTMLTLKFENEGFTYELHQDDNSEEKPPIRAASVDITDANGKAISSVTCKIPTQGSLMKLEDIVPKDEN